ncbi:MAG: FeoB-associated Cys-rich membrane protein [Spirochaetaceae bacterium]|jgi:hypothetical protein|nr:FeoB-associated Cys-rich membrane protein [Spirochaetaceae bacterium]
MSTVIVALIVFGLLAGIAVRLVLNARRGRLACGCENCGRCRSK